MPDDKPEVVVEPTPESLQDQVVVDVPDVKKEAPAKKSDEQDLSRLKWLEGQTNANKRVWEKMQQKIDNLEALLTKKEPEPVKPPPVAANGDFWSEVDPRAKVEIEKLASQKANEILAQKEVERQVKENQKTLESELQKSTEKALQKYPDLQDDASELTQFWIGIVNQHPEWLNNPYGPLLVMREMEELAPQQGIRLNPSRATVGPNKEILKGRGNQGSLPPSRQGIGSNKIVMTQEEKQFTDQHGIDPVRYKEIQRAVEATGGIEA